MFQTNKLLLLFFVCSTSLYAQQIVATWDDIDAELAGWDKATTLTFLEYKAINGNPGGFISSEGKFRTGILTKQADFTGNYLEKGYNTISIDIMASQQQLTDFKPFITLRYSPAFAGWNYPLADFDANAVDTWQHFDVYFDSSWSDSEAKANGWFLSSGPRKSFAETLANIWAISIASDYPQNISKSLGYDNFRLSHTIPSNND